MLTFFFQAEDGIRGLVRSRGLGDVYKRQYVSFGLAVLCGVYLIAVAGWVLLAIGAASILAGILYTGGPRPYGYEGLGEVFVFLFFGVVAVSGSYYVQREDLLLGGSANVLRNIVSLGGSGALCGMIGDDAMGHRTEALVEHLSR